MSRALITALRELPTTERRIKTAAAARGLTLSALSNVAEVNATQLSRAIHGRENLKAQAWQRIAAALDVPIHVLRAA